MPLPLLIFMTFVLLLAAAVDLFGTFHVADRPTDRPTDHRLPKVTFHAVIRPIHFLCVTVDSYKAELQKSETVE